MKRNVDTRQQKYENCIVLTNGNTEKIYLQAIYEEYRDRVDDMFYGVEFYNVKTDTVIEYTSPNGSFSCFTIGRMTTNSLGLVQTAIELKTKYELEQVKTKIWCVFDKDNEDKGNNPFDNAIELAKKNAISYAFSNRQFEVWFVHHFEKLSKKASAAVLMKKINDNFENQIKTEYSKTDKEYFVRCFIPLTRNAIVNSSEILQKFEKNEKNKPISAWQSCTNMHKLLSDLGISIDF